MSVQRCLKLCASSRRKTVAPQLWAKACLKRFHEPLGSTSSIPFYSIPAIPTAPWVSSVPRAKCSCGHGATWQREKCWRETMREKANKDGPMVIPPFAIIWQWKASLISLLRKKMEQLWTLEQSKNWDPWFGGKTMMIGNSLHATFTFVILLHILEESDSSNLLPIHRHWLVVCTLQDFFNRIYPNDVNICIIAAASSAFVIAARLNPSWPKVYIGSDKVPHRHATSPFSTQSLSIISDGFNMWFRGYGR